MTSRILTLEQIGQKFGHLKLRAEARERGEKVPGDDWRAVFGRATDS